MGRGMVLGGGPLSASQQKVLRRDWLACSSKCSFSSCPGLRCPPCSHGDRPRSGTLRIREQQSATTFMPELVNVLP